MNTNQIIQYQSLLNRNIGTSVNCDNMTVDTLQVNGTANIDGVLTADSTGSFADTLTCSNGNYSTDYPSIYLGDTTHSGILSLQGYSNSGNSFIEGSVGGGLDIFTATTGSTLTLQPFKAFNHVVCNSDFTANLGINLLTGQTYKINGSAITTDDIVVGTNKYLNTLSTTNSTEITHTYSLYNLSSSLNNSSINNSKLVNSTFTINGVSMYLGGSFSISASTGNGTAQNQVWITGVSPFSPSYQLLNTSYITESGNLYYTNARARASISTTNTTQITHTYNNTTGVLYSNINVSSILLTQLNSLIYASSAIINTLVLRTVDGDIYAQNIIGVGTLTGRAGSSNNTNLTLCTPSLTLGDSSYSDGVINLQSKGGAVGTMTGSIIQQYNGSTYIDNMASSKIINIGTINPSDINIGASSANITYNSGNFLKYTNVRFTSFNVLVFSAVSTIWYAIRDSTVPANNLVLTYTGRLNEQIEINVRISGSGTGGSNLYMYYDIHIGTQPAYATTSTNPSIVTLTTPTVNQWGSWLFGGISNQYQGIYFTSYYTFTSAGTKTFYPVFRTQTTNSTWSIGSATAGINTLGEMNIRTLF